MSRTVLGLDTSNYRTSAAIVTEDGEILMSRRQLLPVPPGSRGLRQSDAVYAHLKQIKPMLEQLRSLCGGFELGAVCASTSPRGLKDSYMPVFEVGDTIGRGIAAATGIPFFPTDHQSGHIRAALYGTPLEGKPLFLAFHLSGGTTDLLKSEKGKITALGSSLDLYAGQLIDRTGVSLGCLFPSGPEMEQLALNGKSEGRLGCSMAEGDLFCHLSGAEAQVNRWIAADSLPAEDIAREVFDLLSRTAARMLMAGEDRTGLKDALIFGGIASSMLFRDLLKERLHRGRSNLRIVFGSPELSGDNAAGAALIGADLLRKRESGEGA